MTLTYNSHDLETIGACGNPEIVPFNFETTYANDAPERGAILMQQKLGTTSVAFDIGITGTAAERRAKLSTLASWLNVTEPKNLVLPDTPTWFYKAVPDGQVTTERGINGEIAHVAFTLTDPVAFGDFKIVDFSSSSSAHFTVGGNYPTMPTVSINATRDATTELFSVAYNGVELIMSVYMYYRESPLRVDFNCEERTVSYGVNVPDYYPRTITLDSSWFRFQPSAAINHVGVSRGTGTNGTVAWYERWL